jgi:hypothetical protein
MDKTIGHTEVQPGLRGHSFNSEDNLIQEFLVEIRTLSGGWMGDKSFNSVDDATAHQISLWGSTQGYFVKYTLTMDDVRIFNNYTREVL